MTSQPPEGRRAAAATEPDNPAAAGADFRADFCAELERRLSQSPFAELGRDFKNNIRAVVEALLSRMNVVSRDEFEEQNAILAAATEKLAELERQLAALESEKRGKGDGEQPPV